MFNVSDLWNQTLCVGSVVWSYNNILIIANSLECLLVHLKDKTASTWYSNTMFSLNQWVIYVWTSDHRWHERAKIWHFNTAHEYLLTFEAWWTILSMSVFSWCNRVVGGWGYEGTTLPLGFAHTFFYSTLPLVYCCFPVPSQLPASFQLQTPAQLSCLPSSSLNLARNCWRNGEWWYLRALWWNGPMRVIPLRTNWTPLTVTAVLPKHSPKFHQ